MHSSSRLLQLPRELRDIIYSLVLDTDDADAEDVPVHLQPTTTGSRGMERNVLGLELPVNIS
jgi:hypothetical protein